MGIKFKKLLLLTPAMIAAACAFRASAQNYSENIVGYINLTISPGDNLIANELDASPPDNMINTVLQQGVLTGSTFTEWDPVSRQLLPLSVFNGSSWSINYDLAPDETGGVLNSPASTTVTTVGTVVNFDLGTDQSTFVPPTRGAGTYLLGYAVPFNTTTFQDIIGRDPRQGESVQTLDAASQTYSVTTFENGAWDNGTPSIPVDQAAYFHLLDVPEPSTYILLGTGMATLLLCRGRLQRPGRARSNNQS